MEYHGTGLPARARRPEPSWPTVIATTLRLWLERHPVLGKRGARSRRAVALAAVGAVALGAGVAGAVVGHAATSSRAASVSSPAARPRARYPRRRSGPRRRREDEAAKWIAGQVAPSAIVACDPAMCAALQADGLPATRLLVLGTASADPLGSDLVVATARRAKPVRRPPGRASTPLPSSRASAPGPGGSTSARSLLTGRLPTSPPLPQTAAAGSPRAASCCATRASSSPPAPGTALSAGDVDPRLLMMLAALAVEQPVRISCLRRPVTRRGPGGPAPQCPAGPAAVPVPRPSPACGRCCRSLMPSGSRSCRCGQAWLVHPHSRSSTPLPARLGCSAVRSDSCDRGRGRNP